LLRAQDGTTMHEDNYSDHDYAYDRHGDLYHMDYLVYVENAGEYYHTDEEGSTSSTTMARASTTPTRQPRTTRLPRRPA
jgi:hypothetical protein